MWTHFYIIRIQYLGFRYHGWAKQPKVKTLHQMVDKTFDWIMPDKDYKTLAASRTDAMVSVTDFAFELFVKKSLDEQWLLKELNDNFPPDLRALSVEVCDKEFNIISDPKSKEYVYLFSHGHKAHPYSSAFVYTFKEELDIALMQEAAKLFEGEHDFRSYCSQPKEGGQFKRAIDRAEIIENKVLQASFFPDESWAFHIEAKGFLRNQVRLMMGQLYQLGKGAIDLDEFRSDLAGGRDRHFDYIAPASGLHLIRTDLKNNA